MASYPGHNIYRVGNQFLGNQFLPHLCEGTACDVTLYSSTWLLNRAACPPECTSDETTMAGMVLTLHHQPRMPEQTETCAAIQWVVDASRSLRMDPTLCLAGRAQPWVADYLQEWQQMDELQRPGTGDSHPQLCRPPVVFCLRVCSLDRRVSIEMA